MLTDDPRAWQTLEKIAKRSDVGSAEGVPLSHGLTSDARKQQRLNFLAAFLDDAEAPDVKASTHKGDRGPRIAFPFTLEARNIASMKIASILEMPDRPDGDWTPQQWEKLRHKVKEAIKGR